MTDLRSQGPMHELESRITTRDLSRRATNEYIFDMIEEIAKLARRSGDAYVAILLDAIVATRDAIAEDRAAR